jgi:predicted DNA-binding transcriptional regulator AlpA
MGNPTQNERLLTPREAAEFLRVSISWLAKSRMTGMGPAFIKVGRSVRYAEGALSQWTRGRQRMSTSQQ